MPYTPNRSVGQEIYGRVTSYALFQAYLDCGKAILDGVEHAIVEVCSTNDPFVFYWRVREPGSSSVSSAACMIWTSVPGRVVGTGDGGLRAKGWCPTS